jgi:glyoxylase I family protein
MPVVHHITLSVTDIQRSADAYQRLFGPATVVRRSNPEWERLRMQWHDGLVIGVTQHLTTGSEQRFDHTRVGLDHVGLTCADEAEVRAWAHRLDESGFPHGPVEDVPYGWVVTGRDPDGIPVEFFASRP